ncbi:MAG: hypothetical protein WD118_09815 [Phycisphaeraceae bacterium]
MTRLRRNAQAGFATLVTVAMLAFVATALLTFARLTVLEAQHTRETRTAAQQRQLLLAGAATAMARLEGDADFVGTFTVRAPALEGDSDRRQASVVITAPADAADDASLRHVDIAVQFGDLRPHQTLRLAHDGAAWRPTSVTIEHER